MSDKPPDAAANPFDPAAWRQGRDAYLDAWARMMVEAVNSDAYAKTTGTMLDSYLTASAQFREAIEKSMIHALEQLSMPTRADVVSIAERLTNLEMRLDDMDAKLDTLVRNSGPSVPPVSARRRGAVNSTPSTPSRKARTRKTRSAK